VGAGRVLRCDFRDREGQVVRSPVATAVCDHHHWMVSSPSLSLCVPVALGPRRPERGITTLPVPLEPHPILLPPAIEQIHALGRRILALTQHIHRLPPPPPRLAEQPDRSLHLRPPAFPPDPDPHRHLPLLIRSQQQAHLPPPPWLPPTARPDLTHRLRHPGQALPPGGINDQRAAPRDEPLHKDGPEPSGPEHLLREDAAQGSVRPMGAQERYTPPARPRVAIESSNEVHCHGRGYSRVDGVHNTHILLRFLTPA